MEHCENHHEADKGNDDLSKAFRLKESKLRKLLEEKPKNAKLMSELALYLAQRFNELSSQVDSTRDKNVKVNRNEYDHLQKEAIELGKRAIQTVPQKPFGYAALSSIYPPDSPERMEMLQLAIDLSEKDPKHIIALIGLLVRQLLEPRESEARSVKMGRASKNHPNKRPLSSPEESLYNKIKASLTKAYGNDGGASKSLSLEQKQFLALLEYRLGLFFRKKDPSSICLPRTRQHLTNCLEQFSAIPPSDTSLQSQSKLAMAQFWLGTLGEGQSGATDTAMKNQISRCPPEYIVGLYSTFAERFDELLVTKLEYKTPTKLRHLFDQVVVGGKSPRLVKSDLPLRHCLDLGCGTGISGLAFQQVVRKMDGVDLSPEMIAKAKERQCYNSLRVADVVTALEDGPADEASYDLILACDVFCYIGDLAPVFSSVKQLLSPNGFFCFSTELLQNPNKGEGFRLHSCARFSHTQDYILELATKYNFEVVGKEEADCIRKNQGGNVAGMLVILKPRVT